MYMYIHTYILYNFHERKNKFQVHVLLFLNIQCVLSENKDILLYNYNAIIKVKGFKNDALIT